MPLGSLFESRIATTGMPSVFASLIASSSLLVSTTNMTSGRPPMSRMPPRLFSSLSRSRVSWSTSFLVRPAVSPDSCSSGDLSRFGHRVLRLALGADEQDLAAPGDRRLHKVERAREQRHGLREVDDVN